MEVKKISFGFSKTTKKPNLLPTKQAIETPKVELISCLEGKEIISAEEKKSVEAPLVIPLQNEQRTSTALASLMRRRAVLFGEEEAAEKQKQTNENTGTNQASEIVGTSTEDLEKRAAQELLKEVALNNGLDNETSNNLVLPKLSADELPLDGAKEATLDDYESVPIQKFGLAMLRGMGWKDEEHVKNDDGRIMKDDIVPRPKGMGLGADKALKPKPLLEQPERNEVLEIKPKAYVRILGGKFKDLYGQIAGFDDYAGRVIIKMAIGGQTEVFNEFLCQCVAKKEYEKYAKCINSAKYEAYKSMENAQGQIVLPVKSEAEFERKIKKEIKEENEETQTRPRYFKEEEPQTSRNCIKEEREYKERVKPNTTENYKQEQRRDYEQRIKCEDRRGDRAERNYRYADRDEQHRQKHDYERERGSDRTRLDENAHSSKQRQQQQQEEHKMLKYSRHANERQHEQSSTDSDDDSDSDAEDSRSRNKSSKKHNGKHKSKKSKSSSSSSRHKKYRNNYSSASEDDSDDSEAEEVRRKSNKSAKKKKTKKSKKQRSRSRSRGRR